MSSPLAVNLAPHPAQVKATSPKSFTEVANCSWHTGQTPRRSIRMAIDRSTRRISAQTITTGTSDMSETNTTPSAPMGSMKTMANATKKAIT